MTLDEHLGRWYGATVLKSSPTQPLIDELKAEMESDPLLAKAAADRLAELIQIDEQRCFVSARHRELLRAALT